jgi:GH25 family lysozyme M1 (1,4-beta-N-acetylmuramidase)
MNPQNETIIQKTISNTILSGEIRFYNRFTDKIIHRVDMKDVDIDEYQRSDEFRQIILEKEVGVVDTIVHYANHIIERRIY